MNDQTTLTPGGAGPGGAYQERGARTVFGIGRPSLVDFEHHDFGLEAIPDELKYVSNLAPLLTAGGFPAHFIVVSDA